MKFVHQRRVLGKLIQRAPWFKFLASGWTQKKISSPKLKTNRIYKYLFVCYMLMLGLSSCRWEMGEKFGWGSFGYNQGYSPKQPIPFSHKKHAGLNFDANAPADQQQYGIPCLYCHNQEERSQHSNIPAGSTCMNCHQSVKVDSPHIQELAKNYMEGKGMKWVKVHMLPDFVHFNHSAHIAKGVNCEECHGQIEQMDQVSQFAPLSMGWCLDCHRRPDIKAPTNCSTCHH